MPKKPHPSISFAIFNDCKLFIASFLTYKGNEEWVSYQTIEVEGNSYRHYQFPDGYSGSLG